MANTDFKIDDYLAKNPSNQYDFTFPAGWRPLNEATQPALNIERESLPYVNLSYYIDYGLREKIITLQGRDIADSDRYELSAAIADPRIKKLYLGDDWFYYVRGIEPRSSRDAEFPLTYNYTASFLAVDPCMYYDGTTSGDYPAGTAGFGYEEVSSGSVDIDLTDANTNNNSGSWYVEPIIWVDDESGDEGYVEDERGCRLTFTPPDATVWIILPYMNPYTDQFFPDYPIAYNYQTDDLTDYSSVYAQDIPFRGTSPDFKKSSGEYSSSITLSDTNSSHVEKYNNRYPRAEWDTVTSFTVSGWADANVKIQWRYRRL